MTSLKHVLTAADPLRDEAAPLASRRDAIRRRTIAAAGATTGRTPGVARRLVLLGGSATVVLAAVSASWTFRGNDGTLHAAVQFEVRVADTSPGSDTREARDAGSGRTIHLHRDVVLTNDDIAAARVVAAQTGFGVEIELTAAGAARMRSVTSAHVGRLLAIVLDGSVRAAPRITSTIEHVGMISGDYTREEAQRLADGLRPR
jgi:preprotein translocase subunit SecD